MRERTHLEKALNGLGDITRDLEDTIQLIELGEEENDHNIASEGEQLLKELLQKCLTCLSFSAISCLKVFTLSCLPPSSAFTCVRINRNLFI